MAVSFTLDSDQSYLGPVLEALEAGYFLADGRVLTYLRLPSVT